MPTIQIVKNGPVYYPLDEENYALARVISPALNLFDQDTYVLALQSAASSPRRIRFQVQVFDALENEMLDRLGKQFPGVINSSPQHLVFHGPSKIKDARLEPLITKLKAWYGRHHISLDVKLRRSTKTFKLTLTKTRQTR